MVWYAVSVLLTLLLDLFSWRSNQVDKDLEILVLKQQLRILERKLGHQPRISRWEKCLLVVVAVKLLHQTGKARQHLAGLLLFQPDTVLKWHQALVRRKWTFQQARRVGRPATDTDLRALVIRLAQENDWATTRSKVNCRNWAIRWTEPQSRIF